MLMEGAYHLEIAALITSLGTYCLLLLIVSLGSFDCI